ncbi:MAG: hypothetical protein ACYS8W_16255 [Planctomycetota bacterium]|jgi:hypothetical protein
MKILRNAVLGTIALLVAANLCGCVSAESIGNDPRHLSALGTWMIIPPSAYTKLFPNSPTESVGDIKINVHFRGKSENQLLQTGKHLDNILTKISSAENIPVTSLAWIALVKMTAEHGPVAIISSVKEYLDAPVTLDSIIIQEGDGVVVLTEKEFTKAAMLLSKVLSAAGAAPPPEVEMEEPSE